ncbi:MAG: allantoinase AllB [Persicimonas sp.]
MSSEALIIRSQRVVMPDGVRAAAIHIEGGAITRIADFDDVDTDAGQPNIVEADDSVVMAGLVDAHVHINEPGRTEWEGFETATRAAAAGGVTTLIDMPLNCIPATTSVAGLHTKLDAARGKCHVDVGFWGGLVPGNRDELAALWEAGVLGFKCFLCPSGVAEFENVTTRQIEQAMPKLAEMGAVLLCHSELPEIIEDASQVWAHGDARHYGLYLASRPRSAEDQAIAMLCEFADRFDARLHIVHLSSATALPFLRRARSRGVDVSVETCPHYLYFGSDDVQNGATQFKCAPPIRPRGNADELWKALGRGHIDMVATDHSPSPPELKRLDSGRFDEAWGGIASLQLQLPVMWTAARARGFDFHNLTQWLSRAPAALAGLEARKGQLAAGFDADITIWNPDAEFVVDADTLQHRHKLTPYDGRRLQGEVEATYVRGKKVYARGEFGEPVGDVVLREE